MNKLYHGDCLKMLKKMPSDSVDLVVTDPPYVYKSLNKRLNYHMDAWNHELNQHRNSIHRISYGYNPEVLNQLVRVMKKINLYIWVSKDQLLPTLDFFTNCYHCQYTIITWHKTNPTPWCNNKYLNDTEYCLFFKQGGVHVYGNYHTKQTFYVSPTNAKESKVYGHPTVKPLLMTKNFIINSSRMHSIVLDPFMGSNTAGVASELCGRSFIGAEINDKYYRIAKKRSHNYIKDSLFDAECEKWNGRNIKWLKKQIAKDKADRIKAEAQASHPKITVDKNGHWPKHFKQLRLV